MYILRNHKVAFVLLSCLMLFICCDKNTNVNTEANSKKNIHLEIKSLKIWSGILDYMQKYQNISKVFRLQVVNEDKAARLQITYLLKQNDIIRRPPAYYVNVDSFLILVYDGMEEYLNSTFVMDELSNEPLFKQLRLETDSNFLIYHAPVWQFTTNEQNVIIDTLAEPFNYQHLEFVAPLPIE